MFLPSGRRQPTPGVAVYLTRDTATDHRDQLQQAPTGPEASYRYLLSRARRTLCTTTDSPGQRQLIATQGAATGHRGRAHSGRPRPARRPRPPPNPSRPWTRRRPTRRWPLSDRPPTRPSVESWQRRPLGLTTGARRDGAHGYWVSDVDELKVKLFSL